MPASRTDRLDATHIWVTQSPRPDTGVSYLNSFPIAEMGEIREVGAGDSRWPVGTQSLIVPLKSGDRTGPIAVLQSIRELADLLADREPFIAVRTEAGMSLIRAANIAEINGQCPPQSGTGFTGLTLITYRKTLVDDATACLTTTGADYLGSTLDEVIPAATFPAPPQAGDAHVRRLTVPVDLIASGSLVPATSSDGPPGTQLRYRAPIADGRRGAAVTVHPTEAATILNSTFAPVLN